jgi:hypothetical protein
MGEIRLYRQIYCFTSNGSGSTTQTLINANTISASTSTVSSSGNTIIENIFSPINESTGIYYVDLNPNKYSSDITYELNWFVSYVPGAPEKRLPTRFRVNPNIIGEQIEIEILDNSIDIVLG